MSRSENWREEPRDELTLKAKLLIEKIKNEVSNLEQNFEFYQEEHGVDSSNIESLERLLEQVRILNGKNDERDL